MSKSSASRSSRPIESSHGVGHPDALEFPDGSDFNPQPRRFEPAVALKFCEDMSPRVRRPHNDLAIRRDRPAAEFGLDNPADGPENPLTDLLDELLPSR